MADGLPPSWDPELSELFADQPELLETARRLRASRPRPELGTHFEGYLRARLLDATARELRPRGWRRLRPRPAALGWGGVGLGVALIAAVVVVYLGYTPIDHVQVVSFAAAVDGQADVRPDDVIRIAFNQAMDQQAVVAGLRIRPATAVQTRWEGNTLVVTPTHHLEMNTPYTVTIPRDSAKAASGQTAPTPIAITFGTQRSLPVGPPASPSPAPVLALRTVASAGGDHPGLVATGDGGLVVTAATAPPATASPSPAPTAPPTAAAPGTPVLPSLGVRLPVAAAASPSPAGAPAADALLRVGADGSLTRLGAPVAAVAISAHNGSIAEVRPDGQGGAAIVVAGPDGTAPTSLATTDDPATPIAWAGDDLHPTLVYVSGGLFHSVDLQRTVRTLDSRHPVVAGQAVVLAPGGAAAYLGPAPAPPSPSPSPGASPNPSPEGSASPSPAAAPTGEVVDLRTGTAHALPESAAVAAFSGDGARVAWVVAGSGGPQLDIAPTGGGDVTSVLVPGAGTGATADGLGLDATGGRAAYVLHAADGTGELRVVGLPDGAVVATGPAAALQPTLSPAGTLAVLLPDGTGRFSVETAAVPQPSPAPGGGATGGPAPAVTVPGDVTRLLSAVVAAQTASPVDPAALAGLAATNTVPTLIGATPARVDRGYIVRVAADPAHPGTYSAHLRLVRDPTKDAQGDVQPARFADEDMVVGQPAGGAYLVEAVTVTPLQTEPSGPQVLRVEGTATVFRIAVDSDLRADTVAGAVTVRDAQGASLPTTVSYEADSRTLIVTSSSGTPAVLQISTALRDVDGQALAAPFSTPLGTAATQAQPGLPSPGPTPQG